MKIALCQINPTVGAIKQNKQLILDSYSEAINLGAELVVFPELALIGYPPQDLLLRKQFINSAEIALNEIAKQSTVPMILGSTLSENDDLYNCSFVCANGHLIDHYKRCCYQHMMFLMKIDILNVGISQLLLKYQSDLVIKRLVCRFVKIYGTTFILEALRMISKPMAQN